MPIDASIPLRVQPIQAPDFLQQAGQAMSLRNAMQQNRMSDLQMKQVQNAQEELAAFNQALQGNVKPDANGNPVIDRQGLMQTLVNSGHGEKWLSYQKELVDADKSALEMEIKQNSLIAQQMQMRANIAQSVTDQPSFERAIDTMVGNGLLNKNMLQGMPRFYEEAKPLLAQFVNQAMSAKELADFKSKLAQEEFDRKMRPFQLQKAENEAISSTVNPATGMTKKEEATLASKNEPSASEKMDADVLAWGASKLKKPVEQLTPVEKAQIRQDYQTQGYAGKMSSVPGQEMPLSDASGQFVGTYNRQTRSFTPATNLPGNLYQGGQGANIDATTTDRIVGYKTALDLFKVITPMMDNNQSFGPVAGRIKLAQAERIGGSGLTDKEIEMAQRLRRLVTEQAFANGGKQLTPTEKEEFVKLNPALSDTLPQALEKTKQSIQYLRLKLGNTIKGLSPKERQIVHPDILAEVENTQKSSEDPKIKAYADKYFGGDINKAKKAIEDQRKGK